MKLSVNIKCPFYPSEGRRAPALPIYTPMIFILTVTVTWLGLTMANDYHQSCIWWLHPAPTSAHNGLDSLQLALVVFFLPPRHKNLTCTCQLFCTDQHWLYICLWHHIYLRASIILIYGAGQDTTLTAKLVAKFTDEQYTTVNQSRAGCFDPKVFVNCLQACTQLISCSLRTLHILQCMMKVVQSHAMWCHP